MSRLHTAALVATLALGTAGAQAAGTVEVNFIDPDRYTDTGLHSMDRERALADLQAHLQGLARRLPDGQRLRIEVLDIDLAGDVRIGAGHDRRILRGGADWPQMRLRYTLQAGDRTLRQGEDRLSDPAYLFSAQRLHTARSLPYERRMLDSWFGERIAGLR